MLDSPDGIVEFYRDSLATHGPTPEGMAWRDSSTHYRRLHDAMYLCMVLDKKFCSNPYRILDVGCGIGLLPQEWRLEQHQGVTYHGLDLVSEYIDEARRRNGHYANHVFWCGDLAGFGVVDQYNLTLAIGTIAWQPEEVVYKILNKMWELTKPGGIMLFTFLPHAPLSVFDVNYLKRTLGVDRDLMYSGYVISGEIMVAFEKKEGVVRG
jgi:SAM-dependent methyltransferase